MKIDSIYHTRESRRKECRGDRPERRYSKDPIHHPLLLEREYVRALNFTKMERMLAKPFVAALSHHREGICKLTKSCASNGFASASYDNKAILWDLESRHVVSEAQLNSVINGIALDSADNLYVSQSRHVTRVDAGRPTKSCSASPVYRTDSVVTCLSASDDYHLGVGHSVGVSIFDVNRLTPKNRYVIDGVSHVSFNRSFKYIVGALSSMAISLYDNRSCRDFLRMDIAGSNCMSFSPQQGFMFATGNEDGNGYLHDMRNPSRPVETYRGHTNAVVAISFNPNGREIATGSFDRTIRLFNIDERKSRDCYYNDRMQIVHGVEFSNDGKFLISGSDDASLRIWKAHASRKIGPMSRAERESIEYRDALKDKFKHIGEISRISRHRFLNKEAKREMRIRHEMYEGSLRRAARREKERELREKHAQESSESSMC